MTVFRAVSSQLEALGKDAIPVSPLPERRGQKPTMD
jgi:hypothetical protein